MTCPQHSHCTTINIMDDSMDHSMIKQTPTPGPTLLEIVADLNNAGMASIESGDLKTAGTVLSQAIEKCNSAVFFSDLQVRSLSQTALAKLGEADNKKTSYLYQRDDYDEGMSTFTEPMAIFPEMTCVLDGMATVLFNLGQLCLRLGDEQEAYASFMRALMIAGDSSKTNSCVADTAHFVTAVLHNVGHIQYRNAKYEEAIHTYSRALAIGRQAYGRSTHDMLAVSSTLNCLGVLHFHLPKVDTQRAISLYHEALTIRRAVLGQDAETVEISTILNNIGRVFYMKLEYNAALKMYSESLRMRRRLLGDNHLDVAATVYNAGQTLHQRGDLDQAMNFYREFLRIAKNKLGEEHRDVAVMLKCMAQIHHEKKEYQEATCLYEEAIKVAKAALGDKHPEIATM
jgi:tetratricopeptide (TPR) repeat protein